MLILYMENKGTEYGVRTNVKTVNIIKLHEYNIITTISTVIICKGTVNTI